jgi:CRISPR/Cas system CSM-associated protein Csm3 (group 7 of RAMP superfamily)
MKLFEKYRDTRKEIDYLFIETDKEYEDLDMRSIKGERFVRRNYLSDWYSKLTKEQKKLISQFQVLFGSALMEDRNDEEYNFKNYTIIHKNSSMKGAIIIEK